MVDRPPLRGQKPMTPGRLFRAAAILYVFWNIFCFTMVAICDSQNDAYHSRLFMFALLWGSTTLVASTYLTMRRAWKQLPAADWADGVLPAAVIFAIGWAIWQLAHL